MIRIACISDLHEQWDKVKMPEADILILAGDITYNGSISAMVSFCLWLKALSYKAVFVVAGNHDLCLENEHAALVKGMVQDAGATYLQDSGAEYDGLKIWGSPYTPRFHDWAFNVDRGKLHKYWSRIPEDTNILITHGPPLGILDRVPNGGKVGCRELLEELPRLKDLRLHCFGHIHHSHGVKQMHETIFVNASICTEQYKPTNAVRVVEL